MAMNECTNSDVRDLLPLLATGGQVDSSATVEAHIAGCEACREELALLKAARQALLRAPVIDAARIARAVPAYGRVPATDPKVVPIESRRVRAPTWRIAAAAVILVVAGTALTVRQAAEDPPTRPIVSAGDSAGTAGRGAGGSFARIDTPSPSGTGSATPVIAENTGSQMTFGGGLEDLTEEELVALLAALDEDESLTPVEPEEDLPSMSVDGEEES